MKKRRLYTDFLVIGSGLAGLTFARKAAKLGDVVIITKDKADIGCTTLAQGGIAAVLEGKTSIQSHIQDTIKASGGLAKEEIVEKVVKAGPKAAEEMIELGVHFDRDEDDPTTLYLTREGGHSENRVLHVADTTGKSLENMGLKQIDKKSTIKLFEHNVAIDILTQHHINGKKIASEEPIKSYGAYVYDERAEEVYTIFSNFTVIATGGAGNIYKHTTNPEVSTGDGIAMGYRAGAIVANMEFIQFHPTTLYDLTETEKESFLISEAVRGEGGLLRLENGYRFMKDYEPEQMELAPRDVVARAIDSVLKKTGQECVYLDITHKDSDFIKRRFPNIYKTCLRKGIDITKDRIPVVPAAHYSCGGILVDEHGRTNIEDLYAIGEVAYSGLHGANRLASNSLLEAAVFAHFAYKDVKKKIKEGDYYPAVKSKQLFPSIADWDEGEVFDQEEWVIISHNQKSLRELMWNYVGIVRSDLRLSRALERISLIVSEVNDFYQSNPVKRNVLELRNMAYVGWLVIRSALSRTESRGLHFNSDHPSSLPGKPVDTLFRSSRFGEDEHVR
ncbi:MAG: L-aspartate oxidase [Candidatus Zixiibacteriota bacterium]